MKGSEPMNTIKDKTILLVDDEPAILQMCKSILKENGFENILTANTALSALEKMSVKPDMAILDVMLPDMDGFTLAKTIREQNIIPILFLTAKGEINDKSKGFEVGADDYMVKPFDFPELVARINVLLRIDFIQSPAILICGAVKMDTLKREVFVSRKKVALTKKEYSILEYLLRHKGEVVSAERLIEHVWDSDADLFSNSLKYHLSMLKKKLGVNCIKNIRGQGYIIGG